MIKVGAAPYLECSGRGDKRFSAFYARPKSLKGKSIEEAYQGMKRFADGTTSLDWRAAKGRHPVNADECRSAYETWWREYVIENNLQPVLRAATGLSDLFGQPGHICQALTLWKIRNEEL